MGGLCSKTSNKTPRPPPPSSKPNFNGNAEYYGQNKANSGGGGGFGAVNEQVRESMEKQSQEAKLSSSKEKSLYSNSGSAAPDDFYDGIPRYPSLKSRSIRSVAKVSEEVSSRLSRAGTVGLGKAVEVLDTLGSSMTNLNKNNGFAASVAAKGNELSILAFEVANTVVKGSNLMQSLSKRSIRHLKEVVLPSEGVQNLISTDTDELLRIVAADKREELKIFSGEVVRFGNRCKDPQWHNLDRYFEKISIEITSLDQLKEEAEYVMELLMTLVGHTAELYHELQVLDRIEQDYQRKRQEEDKGVAHQRGDSLGILRSELKSQKKLVRNLKKKSLWSRNLEEVMEKLVDVVHYFLVEINNTFGSVDDDVSVKGNVSSGTRLGPAGLSLHYANMVMQIDTLVARSSSMPPNTRDALYQSLPPNIKSALRSKLQTFHAKEELTITEIKDEMEKTLQWLVPISTNTAKAHHGFGWVGEWANAGSDANRKPAAGPADIIRIETLHHADKEKTEAYILELVLWLNHLANKSKTVLNGFGMKSAVKSPINMLPQKSNQLPTNGKLNAPSLSTEDQKMLQDASKKSRKPRISKSHDFDTEKTRLRKHDRLSKSSNYSPPRESEGIVSFKRFPSMVPITAFGIEKEKALDAIDRVDDVVR